RTLPVPKGSNTADTAVQSSTTSTAAPTVSRSFDGIGDGVNGFNGLPFAVDSLPPDPNGAVGPNNFVEIVNESFEVFSKTGTPQYGPVSTNTLFTGFGGDCESLNDGD